MYRHHPHGKAGLRLILQDLYAEKRSPAEVFESVCGMVHAGWAGSFLS